MGLWFAGDEPLHEKAARQQGLGLACLRYFYSYDQEVK